MRVKEKFNKKLFVEGNDDQHVVWALCERLNLVENFDVIDKKGINSLIDQLSALLKLSAVDTVGIIIDADTDLSYRWDRLSRELKTIGYIVPENLPKGGLIIKQDSLVTVGVWIMPNNTLNGMIEDFISFLVPTDDKLLGFANQALDLIEKEGFNKYKPIHKSKALAHTWLAWQDDPGTPMGQAITKRYLTTEAEICGTFINWLQQLFSA